MSDKGEAPAPRATSESSEGAARDDDVIRIEDLAPRGSVKGGRKILLGEIPTPLSNPRIPPGS